jgi:hypothetical protein
LQRHALIVLLLLLLQVVVLLRAHIDSLLMMLPRSMVVSVRQPLLLLRVVIAGSCSRAEQWHLIAITRHAKAAVYCTICCTSRA